MKKAKKTLEAKEDSFMLVDLKEDKAKDLAQVISNKTARKILDYLASRKDASETEIASELKLPISTVHYNLKTLTDTNLVIADEFHYSEKGREILHYKLANKTIIIAPQHIEKESFRKKLARILPVVGIVAVVGVIIQFVQSGMFAVKKAAAPVARSMMESAVYAKDAVQSAAPVAMSDSTNIVMEESARAVVGSGGGAFSGSVAPLAINATPTLTNEAVVNASSHVANASATLTQTAQPIWTNIAFWFVIGAIFALILIWIFSKIIKKK